MKILVVDDHAIFARALGHLLARDPDLTVVGTFNDPDSALASPAIYEADLIVLDAVFAGVLDPRPVVLKFRAARPDARIVILSGHSEPSVVKRAIEAGADGFVAKSTDFDEFTAALRAVGLGDPVICGIRGTIKPRRGGGQLGVQEVRVASLVADGLSNAEIARELGLAVSTVKNHVSSAISKLGFRRRTELVRWHLEQRPR